MAKLLIVDSDKCRAEALRKWLTREMHVVDVVDNGAAGLEQLCFHHFDACILNWNAQLLSALEVITQYRSAAGGARILLLMDWSAEQARIQALDAGADDCVADTCSLRELSARMRALLRRPNVMNCKVIRFSDCVFNLVGKCLTKSGVEIKLQPKEYQLLEFMLHHPNYFFKAESLLRRVWVSSNQVSEETVRTHIKTLRRKLDTPGMPSIISTAPGLGYKLNVAQLVEPTELFEVAC